MKKPGKPVTWITREALAAALGVAYGSTRDILRRAPPGSIRREGRRIFINGRAVIEAHLRRTLRREVEAELRAEAAKREARDAEDDFFARFGMLAEPACEPADAAR